MSSVHAHCETRSSVMRVAPRWSIFCCLLVLSVLFSSTSHARSANTATAQPAVQDFVGAISRSGSTRVIVGLRVPTQPEVLLLGAGAVQAQRNAIDRAQDALMRRHAHRSLRLVAEFTIIPYMTVEVDSAALDALRHDPEVESITEDRLSEPLLYETNSLIGANTAWSYGYTGSGQTIAVLDTGVDTDHSFLAGKTVAEACFSSNVNDGHYSSTTFCPNGQMQQTSVGAGVNCDTSIKGCDHGTHVAGIAVGKSGSFSGIARDATVLPVQVFSRFSSTTACGSSVPCALSWTTDQIRGLEWVYSLRNEYNIAAVNISIGGGQWTSTDTCDKFEPAMKSAIDQLRSAGIATVIASGNNGYTNATSYPACISTSISVGSTTKCNGISGYSNSATWLTILAPGGQSSTDPCTGGGIYAPVPTSAMVENPFGTKSGTSMAAPHVAGAWAVLRSKSPQADVNQILQVLRDTGLSITDTRNGINRVKQRIRLGHAVESNALPACNDAYEPNDSSSQAQQFLVGTTQPHRFCTSQLDQDWVKFTAKTGSKYRIRTLNLEAGVDTQLALYEADGTTWITSDDTGGKGQGDEIVWTIQSAGTYYVRVRQQTGSTSGAYSLEISELAACTDAYEANNSVGTANVIEVDTTQRHSFCLFDDVDWVSFSAEASETYAIETQGVGRRVDTVLELVSSDGTSVLVTASGSNTNGVSRISFAPALSGTYYLRIRHVTGASDPELVYDLSLMQTQEQYLVFLPMLIR